MSVEDLAVHPSLKKSGKDKGVGRTSDLDETLCRRSRHSFSDARTPCVANITGDRKLGKAGDGRAASMRLAGEPFDGIQVRLRLTCDGVHLCHRDANRFHGDLP